MGSYIDIYLPVDIWTGNGYSTILQCYTVLVADEVRGTGGLYGNRGTTMAYEIVLEGRQGNEDMLTVLHYETIGGLAPDWDEIAEDMATLIGTDLLSALTPNASYLGFTYREDSPGEVGIFVPFPGAPLVGTNGSGDSITQVAVNVVKYSDTGNRPGQGRIYQGGIAVEYAEQNGQWAVALIDLLDTFWADMRTLTQNATEVLRMVIKASNTAAPNTVPYNPVSRIVTKSNPVTLTRRKRGVGS